MSDQLPPADELQAVRAQLKTLGEREVELRRLMLSDPSARTGNRYAVNVKTVTQDRTDIQEMRACHHDLVAEFTFPVTITRIEIVGINEDGELVSLRKHQKQNDEVAP
jgi:predicted SnoaL-like aldol condensation-catalyzing enzyme